MFWKKRQQTILLVIIDFKTKKEILKYDVIETPNVGDWIHIHKPFEKESPKRAKIVEKSYGIFLTDKYNNYGQGVCVYVDIERKNN